MKLNNPLHSQGSALAPLVGLSILCLVASPVQGATSITNPLSGFTGNSQTDGPAQPKTLAASGLNVTFVWDGGEGAWERIDFSTAGATFGGNTPTDQGNDQGRNFLRTNDGDYATGDFKAYVTVKRSTRESVFFGMGTGAMGEGKSPDAGTGNASVFLHLQDGFDNASRHVLGGPPDAASNVEDGFDEMTTVLGPMRLRLRMDYDARAKTVTYSIDYTPSRAFHADQTFAPVSVASIIPEWEAGEKSSIYFGGQGSMDGATRVGMTFTDFEVTVSRKR